MNELEMFLRLQEVSDAEEAARLMQEMCGSDVQLRLRIEELLACHLRAEASEFLKMPAVEVKGAMAAAFAMQVADEAIVLPASWISRRKIGDSRTGRYRLLRILGQGNFGVVHLAFDEQLHRQVAVKVPRKDRFTNAADAEKYLYEARIVAGLDHPHIVTVFDVGRTEDGSIYVVSRFINGGTLADRLKTNRPDFSASVGILETVSSALQHAHTRRLIHRDIKPANILMDEANGHPFLADFGIAISEEDFLKESMIFGTPSYMSPEQARGEGHRLDGRSDIFSLGSVFYEMLTGQPPFAGSSLHDILEQVKHAAPVSPRSLNPSLPAELERVCLKMLSKRATDRYASCNALIEDLKAWRSTEAARSAVFSTPAAVISHGLRAFDAGDAGFFLDLLPGIRDQDGLPESIAFWKRRIEETDPERTFATGLLLGPGGCGKSSLVKAGLQPHLSKSIVVIYVEAAPDETESRILRRLRKKCENLDESLGLVETLSTLRRGFGRKTVIIIDQFEQWLQAHQTEADAELIRSLRHCDGGRLQAIVMVRDDFWMAAARFMRALDTRIVEGHNFETVDLFEVDHARFVLTRFGQAFGKLPAKSEELRDASRRFLETVASGLAVNGKVAPVRLALFAEMVKARPWTLATLEQIGGTEGVGVNFLEESFTSRNANPEHRLHAMAARRVLKALLPGLDTDIKGGMKSNSELQAAAGYENRPAAFSDLLRILDAELRLITPVDPTDEFAVDTADRSPSGRRCYQLTHDFLVPALRQWLNSKQKETRKGRAELTLQELSSIWKVNSETRFLPSLPEWISIRTLTESNHWSAPQRAMMAAAASMYGRRTAALIALACILIAVGLGISRQAQSKSNQLECERKIEALLLAETTQVDPIIDKLSDLRKWADPLLKQEFADSPTDSTAKLHSGLALTVGRQTIDPEVLEFLRDRLLTVTSSRFRVVLKFLEPHKPELIPVYWKTAVDEQRPPGLRFHAACALASFDPDGAHQAMVTTDHVAPNSSGHVVASSRSDKEADHFSGWDHPGLAKFIVEHLVAGGPNFVSEYQELLRPVAHVLVPALSEIFKDPGRDSLSRGLTTLLLVDYAAGDANALAELVIEADLVSDTLLFPALQKHQAKAVKKLESVLQLRLKPTWNDTPLDMTWTEPSFAVRAQIESACGVIAERFAFCQNMPLTQFFEFAETLRPSGYRPTRVRPYQGLVAHRHDANPAKEAELHSKDEEHYVAAIWTRDGWRWHLDPSLKQSELPASDAPAAWDNMLLADIAPLPKIAETTEPPFVALWSEFPSGHANTSSRSGTHGAGDSSSEGEQRRLLIDLTDTELSEANTKLLVEGFSSQCTITVRIDADSQRRYTGIYSNQGAPSELRRANAALDLVYEPQWDLAQPPEVDRNAKSPDPREQFRVVIADFEKPPAEKQDDPKTRLKHAVALHRMGQQQAALRDLDFLLLLFDKKIMLPGVLEYRTLVLAALGNSGEARQSLTNYLATEADASSRFSVEVQVWVFLGELERALAQLDATTAAAIGNSEQLYKVASTAALCLQTISSRNEAAAQQFADRAVAALNHLVLVGDRNVKELKQEPDFVSLHTDTRFLRLLSELERSAQCAAIWRADTEVESKLLLGVPSESVAERLNPLLIDGWRPFAIASADSCGTSLILHRPLIADGAKEKLANQQAAAAAALLRFNAPDKVWPLFDDQPDPRLQSQLVHRLVPYGIDPQSLLQELRNGNQVARRRSLIIGLGEFAKADLLSEEQRNSLIEDFARRYAEDRDPGVHGACEWSLRQLRATDRIQAIQLEYSTGQPAGARQWYLTKSNSKSAGQTMVIIQPEEEFRMGSPITETERTGGPTHVLELPHRRRIGRRFSIGMHEVTVAQFREFRPAHEFESQKASQHDLPAHKLTWYEAAEYCNWLSEKEEISPNEFCYVHNESPGSGITMAPQYLQRKGYRLPTESEWEYACRSDTMTARYYGETADLLPEYAWFSKNAGDRTPRAVGRLKPNADGLFDILGNVTEWCQNSAVNYSRDRERLWDVMATRSVSDSEHRIIRGGALDYEVPNVRSADRTSAQPSQSAYFIGFRVARTQE